MTHAANVNASDYVTTVIESLMRLGHRGAILVGTYLTMLGAIPKKRTKPPLVIPPIEMALGLAAMFQIWLWERAGLRPYIRVVDLPTSHDALNDFWNMESCNHAEYIRSKSGSRLLKQVVGAFLSHCAFAAPEELGVDIVMDGTLEDSLLEEFVDFVWRHRHLMTLED